mmetsp:Transcript_14415/g.23828  ORF Transcript_14415/g.23828 Transcript_14415/m.23828 type:complete len:99 (-) Transcript_14415:119-415(-)
MTQGKGCRAVYACTDMSPPSLPSNFQSGMVGTSLSAINFNGHLLSLPSPPLLPSATLPCLQHSVQTAGLSSAHSICCSYLSTLSSIGMDLSPSPKAEP